MNGTTVTEEVTGSFVQVDSLATLTLKGGATIQGLSSTVKGAISNSGTIEVAGPASLLNDTLTNMSATGSIIQVDDGQTLTLSGTEIINGTINDFSPTTGGTIDVTGSSKIDGNATLNQGLVKVEAATLTLDNVTVNGTTVTEEVTGSLVQVDSLAKLTLKGGATIQGLSYTDTTSTVKGAISNSGTIEVSGPASLLNDTLTNMSATGSIIQVDDGQTLTLSGTEIIGGTINDFSPTTGGTIDVTGSSKIDGGASLNNGYVTIESGKVLTLDNVTVTGTIFTDVATSSTIQIDIGDTLAFNGATINGGTLNVFGELDFDRHQPHQRGDDRQFQPYQCRQRHSDHRSHAGDQYRHDRGEERQHPGAE